MHKTLYLTKLKLDAPAQSGDVGQEVQRKDPEPDEMMANDMGFKWPVDMSRAPECKYSRILT